LGVGREADVGSGSKDAGKERQGEIEENKEKEQITEKKRSSSYDGGRQHVRFENGVSDGPRLRDRLASFKSKPQKADARAEVYQAAKSARQDHLESIRNLE
jgi:hypothetical protein